MSAEEAGTFWNGKEFTGPAGEHIKNYGQQVVSVRTPEGFAHKSTWQVADATMLRKEGNVYVLDLFEKVPSDAVAPIKYKPMKVDANSQVADGRERGRRVTFDCNSSTF